MKKLGRFIIFSGIFISILLLMLVNNAYGGIDYTNYEYPDGLSTEVITDIGDWFDTSDDKKRQLVVEEIHKEFYEWCRFDTTEESYLKPECVEIIVDAKLTPIHDKLDFLISERMTETGEIYVPNSNYEPSNSFEQWLMENYS